MDLKDNNDLDEKIIFTENKNISYNNFIENINGDNSQKQDVYFYIMTLQADGERHQIKIFENSDASELAFNFCKTYNLDFQTMKYLKKCIKPIIANFNNIRKNEMIYLLKDNNSIQEVAEEEIITDNSLKKSGTNKKNNSNTLNNEENYIPKSFDNDKKTKDIKDNIIEQKFEEKKEINNNKKIFSETKNKIENDTHMEIKDYSVENESQEIFPPTEHTTKIEHPSYIKNNSSFYQNNIIDKKKNSKNNKLQIKNNNNFNYNSINKKQSCLLDLNKIKKEKNNSNEINTNELKNILIQYKEINTKEFKNKNKTRSKEKKNEIEKDKNFLKKNNYMQFNKKPKSLEKMKKKNNKSSTSDNKNKDLSKPQKNITKFKKHEKFLSHMNVNEINNNYFSNYYDYFMKSKNFNHTLTKNNAGYKFQISNSINQDSNRSRSISNHKNNNNMTQKISMRYNGKKEKSMMDLNTLNTLIHQKKSSTSRFNVNTILNKENLSKEKQKTVFKNKIKRKYSIICNRYNNNFNKTINGLCNTSRAKIKNINGQELFMESKKNNSKEIKKMVTESLLNIHKYKDPSKEKIKNMNINGRVIKTLNNKYKKKSNDLIFNNESNIENSLNFIEQLYYEYGTNPTANITTKNKRNFTDNNLSHKKSNFRDECKKNF